MKSLHLARLTLLGSGLCAALATSSAFAEYRVTAFGHTLGFKELLINEAELAQSKLENLSSLRMGFSEMNNLCVSSILLTDFEEAIDACATALDKAETAIDISASEEKRAKASILSNMAVARAQSGDTLGAKTNLELALTLNSADLNANVNYAVVSEKVDVTEVASK